MKKTAVNAALLAASFLITSVAHSQETISLNYDGFFDRIEKLDEPEFQNVKLAFYLKDIKNGHPCSIKSVQLKTKLKSLDVYFYDTGEIILPFDKQYDLDKAQVVIEKSDTTQCGLDMRLESVSLFSSEIKAEKLKRQVNDFNAALKEQTGMMSFLAPTVTGITFIATGISTLSFLDNNIGTCNDFGCTITNIKSLNNDATVRLSARPEKVIPYIQK